MKPLPLLFFLTALICCNKSKNANERQAIVQLKNAEWLLGKWENTTDDGVSIEFWEKENDSAFSGQSFMIANGDTVFSEKLKLAIINDTLYYIPIVKDQNAGEPVYFKFKSGTPYQLIFENEMHDFPRLITYSKLSDESILAEISGVSNGRESSIQFPMRRKK